MTSSDENGTAAAGKLQLGHLLRRARLVTQEQIDEALQSRLLVDGARERLGQALVRLGFVTEADVAEMLSEQMGLGYVAGDDLCPDPLVASRLSGVLARRHRLVPLTEEEDGTLVVACADPTDVIGRDDVRTATGARRVRAVVAPASEIDAVIRRVYDFEREAGELLGALDPDPMPEDDLELVAEADGPMIRLVDGMIADAIDAGASDIHVEPQASATTVRYRVDGVLHEAMVVPRRTTGQLLARLKIIAGMDIAERRLPQDGRARFAAPGEEVDLRVSTLPSLHGETIVIRVLRKGAERLSLDEVGMDAEQRARFVSAIERPQGLVLITGPTGSGKTSTLYAGLQHLADDSRNIVTLEDPVEYELAKINQTPVNARIGRTFARCLRTVLRQDPDIVMVGEIRDAETAELALQASMTGHLVLSTLHTNDAPSAAVRLRDLGVPAYLIAGSLTMVVAQRLVRRVCQHCAVEAPPTDRQAAQLQLGSRHMSDELFRVGAGCTRCGSTGYRGRAGLFEVLHVDAGVRDLLVTGASSHEIRRAARTAGMRSLREEGLALASGGLTTLDELLRVSPGDLEQGDERTCPVCVHSVQPDFAHCPWCATPLGLPACAACERSLEFGWNVCPGCGTPVTKGAEHAGLPRALVVDDDESVRAAVRVMLADDYEVVEAADAQGALERAHTDRPSIVLLDVGLPDRDGYAVTRELRGRQQTMDLPIMLFTGSEGPDTELRGLQAGADDYITKPVDPDILRARLAALLRRRAA
jgi:type IV pilus assembly protein PilB